MELGHLPYKKGTYEDYVGRAGLERDGKKKWRRHVADVVERLMAALRPDETVIGGGNVKKLDALPPRCRAGENANAFRGGFRLWARSRCSPVESADPARRSLQAKKLTTERRGSHCWIGELRRRRSTCARMAIK